VQTCDREIATFQNEKQAKLNELFVAVPLRLEQIYHYGVCWRGKRGARWLALRGGG
jgi:hypothetical protein